MATKQQVNEFIDNQVAVGNHDIAQLHKMMLQLLPKGKLWFDDGKSDGQKSALNPTIGYGSFMIKYANGKAKEFFQVGISPNSSGTSVYILGIKDKNYLANTYSSTIGKAKVTGYCIRFKSLADINKEVLKSAICYGLKDSLKP